MPQTTPGALLGAPTAAQVRDNPFRVLGLPTHCSGAVARRTAERVAAQHRLGAAVRPQGPLPPPSVPDDAVARRAAHDLRDPGSRLVAELFWLDAGAGQDATDRNLAVHALVGLADADAAGSPAPDPGHWETAPARWSQWLAAGGTPAKVRDRARELGVPAAAGLDDAEVRRLLTRAFLRPYLELAVRAVDRREDVAARLAAALAPACAGAPGLDGREVAAALGDVVDRASRHIDTVVEEAWEEVRAEPGTAHATARRLVADLGPWAGLMTAADAPGRSLAACSAPVRTRAGQLADMIVACASNWVDATDEDDLRASHELARQALPYACDDPLRSKIAETVEGLAALLDLHDRYRSHDLPVAPDQGGCALCGREAADLEDWIAAPMRWPVHRPPPDPALLGALGLTPGAPVNGGVPRCEACAARSRAARGAGESLSQAGAWLVGGLIGSAVAGFATGWPGVVLAGLFLVVLAVRLGRWARARHVHRTERKAVLAHPFVARLTLLGYELDRDWQYLDIHLTPRDVR